MNPLTQIDFYKADHRRQYPSGTTLVYSNMTARSDRYNVISTPLFNGCVTFFGLQYFIKHFLQSIWQTSFFDKPKGEVVLAYKRRMDNALGKDSITTEHVEALHDLGYLPISIRALPEGTQVPLRVPFLVIYNTDPDFFWLTNYLETAISSYLWRTITSATIAHHYRILLEKHAEQTSCGTEHIRFQAHDFSFRGMSGAEDAAMSGAAHLTSFCGTDCVASIDFLEEYYGANSDRELIGCSVPATEHSVMCMGSRDNEVSTFRRLITELYPTGIVSIVSDTWDFWKVLAEYAVELKDLIESRDGKVVFRPDSGDPVKIICGDIASTNPYAQLGAVEVLWRIFGGTINSAGFKTLNPKVGLIYGDSITLERADKILEGLKEKGYAANNIVFGVGSYTYQHVTRDTFGFAIKTTAGCVRGNTVEVYKDPVTDNGVKKSAKGFLSVRRGVDGKLVLKEQESAVVSEGDEMREFFRNGILLRETTLKEIRGVLSW